MAAFLRSVRDFPEEAPPELAEGIPGGREIFEALKRWRDPAVLRADLEEISAKAKEADAPEDAPGGEPRP